SCGTSSKACTVKPTLLCGFRIHSAKLTTAACTTRCTLARCDASSSAKNGSLSCIAATASVANRPEYCLSLRSSDSGTLSRSSRVDRGAAEAATEDRGAAEAATRGPRGLLVIVKSYAIFLEISA